MFFCCDKKSPLASETMVLAQVADPGFLVVSLIQVVYGLSYLSMIECLSDNLFLIKFLRAFQAI